MDVIFIAEHYRYKIAVHKKLIKVDNTVSSVPPASLIDINIKFVNVNAAQVIKCLLYIGKKLKCLCAELLHVDEMLLLTLGPIRCQTNVSFKQNVSAETNKNGILHSSKSSLSMKENSSMFLLLLPQVVSLYCTLQLTLSSKIEINQFIPIADMNQVLYCIVLRNSLC